MQSAVIELVKLGPLPSSVNPDIVVLEKFQTLLSKVEQPISTEEARSLIKLFGPDDCFGLAWTLLHLIETAREWPLEDCFDSPSNEWMERLRKRSANKEAREDMNKSAVRTDRMH